MRTAEDPSALLRPGLLDGVSIVLVGAPQAQRDKDTAIAGRFEAAALASLSALGARVAECRAALDGEPLDQEQASEQAMAGALDQLGGEVDVLVVDGEGLFAVHQQGREALAATLQASWNAVRALANAAFLPQERGGRVFLLAPPPDAGEHAEGTRAGLENLARTLSIEWARYGVTIVTIALGCDTDPGEAAALLAYLSSPAGSYFSGCLLDLRGAASGRF